jgi:hypothetical protein
VAAPYGIEAIAAAYVLRAYLTMPVQLWFLHRHTGITPLPIARAISPSLVAAVLMASAMLAVHGFTARLIVSPIPSVAAMTVFGALVYAGLLLVLGGKSVRADAGHIWSMVTKRARSPARTP